MSIWALEALWDNLLMRLNCLWHLSKVLLFYRFFFFLQVTITIVSSNFFNCVYQCVCVCVCVCWCACLCVCVSHYSIWIVSLFWYSFYLGLCFWEQSKDLYKEFTFHGKFFPFQRHSFFHFLSPSFSLCDIKVLFPTLLFQLTLVWDTS